TSTRWTAVTSGSSCGNRRSWRPPNCSRPSWPTRTAWVSEVDGGGTVTGSVRERVIDDVPGVDGAAVQHLGIDAHLVVAELLVQPPRQVDVAFGGVRVDLGGGAPFRGEHAAQPQIADGDLLVHERTFAERRESVEVDVGAETPGIQRHVEALGHCAHRGEVDQR